MMKTHIQLSITRSFWNVTLIPTIMVSHWKEVKEEGITALTTIEFSFLCFYMDITF